MVAISVILFALPISNRQVYECNCRELRKKRRSRIHRIGTIDSRRTRGEMERNIELF